MQIRIWIAMGIAALGWGTSGVATRAALDAGVEPFNLVAWRIIMAVVITASYLWISQRSIVPDRETWGTGWVLAVTNLAIPFVLFTYAFHYAGAGFVGLIAALIPLGTAVIANFVLPNESLTPPKILGLGVGFVGIVALVTLGDTGIGEAGNPWLAGLLGLVSVASIAFAGVYAKGRAGTYDPVHLTLAQLIIGAAILVAFALIVESPQRDITARGWAMLVYMAVMGTAVPFILFYWVLARATATKASMIGYVVPLIAVAAGIIFLDEMLETGILLGGALILAGVVITDQAERRARTTTPSPS